MRLARWIPPVAIASLIWWLSSRTFDFVPRGLPSIVLSIVGHLVSFGALSASLALALSPRNRPALFPILITVLYGLVDELHQARVPGRDATPADVAVDAVAAWLGIVVLDRVRLMRKSREPASATRRR